MEGQRVGEASGVKFRMEETEHLFRDCIEIHVWWQWNQRSNLFFERWDDPSSHIFALPSTQCLYGLPGSRLSGPGAHERHQRLLVEFPNQFVGVIRWDSEQSTSAVKAILLRENGIFFSIAVLKERRRDCPMPPF